MTASVRGWMMTVIAIKRVYLPPAKGDGCRVLVDRLWPRGLKKEEARVDHWLRELAPSNELRKWFGHEAEKWPEFRRRYIRELDANQAAVVPLRELIGTEAKVTLLFGAREEEHNNAVALAGYLRGHGN